MYISIKKVLKQAILLVLLTGLSSIVFSQNKEVDIKSTNAQDFISKLVPGKGVLVSYSTVDYQSTVSYNPTLVFYDTDLNKKWELKDYSNSDEIKKAYYDMYFNAIPKTQGRGILGKSACFVDPSGKYAYSVNFSKSIINRIDIESGKVDKITLDKKMHLSKQGVPDYSLDAFVDGSYFYLVEGNDFDSKGEAKEESSIFIRRVKHGETKAETFTINPVSPEDDKGSVYKRYLYTEQPFVRQWENLMVVDNVIVLMDNFIIENKDTKQFYKKLVLYPLDGSKHEEKMIKMGEKIADDDLLGEVLYDNVHNRIYTYSMNKDNGDLIASYRCYNSKMALIWEKNFDPKLGKQVLQKVINPAVLKINYDNSVSIKSRYGDNHYTVRTDKNGDNPEFIINETCAQGKLDEDGGYTLDCHEFNSLQKAKGLKSYIMKDKSSNGNKVSEPVLRIMKKNGSWLLEANFYVFVNKVIFVKGSATKTTYKLTSFDMP